MTGGGSSIPAVQRLLSTLAAGRRCAEAGTAFGEGATAIAETAQSLVTVELDEERAQLARARLDGLANVELVVGDWRAVLPERAPFELLFLDGGGLKQEPEVVGPLAVRLLGQGGLLVIDDLTPGLAGHDPARSFLLEHEELVATEILTTPHTAAIVAARRF
ncbi:MAG TPA: class I SAM-dependent methyltransferase [Gaiellaceae bacterium]|nr:class I SAM-dependent methyltransferase [Gaiellaceae bacterium]